MGLFALLQCELMTQIWSVLLASSSLLIFCFCSRAQWSLSRCSSSACVSCILVIFKNWYRLCLTLFGFPFRWLNLAYVRLIIAMHFIHEFRSPLSTTRHCSILFNPCDCFWVNKQWPLMTAIHDFQQTPCESMFDYCNWSRGESHTNFRSKAPPGLNFNSHRVCLVMIAECPVVETSYCSLTRDDWWCVFPSLFVPRIIEASPSSPRFSLEDSMRICPLSGIGGGLVHIARMRLKVWDSVLGCVHVIV